jgi:hypothetical protein
MNEEHDYYKVQVTKKSYKKLKTTGSCPVDESNEIQKISKLLT